MDVTFRRTGARRYAVAVRPDGRAGELVMDPAPGYDPFVPHDLVHFLVEAELGLRLGIYGRLAAGGGGFRAGDQAGRRRRDRREARLRVAGHGDMARSEAVAGRCLIAWKFRRGQLSELPAGLDGWRPLDDQGREIENVLARLDEAAARWHATEIGQEITFTWPHAAARPTSKPAAPRRSRPIRR